MKCLGIDIKVTLGAISNKSIETFVKSLDIGSVSQIPDVPGVTRTVTGLVFMTSLICICGFPTFSVS